MPRLLQRVWRRRWLLAAALALSLAGWWVVWLQRTVIRPRLRLVFRERDCSDRESVSYLESLCRDYLNGVVGGSLCEPLCVRKEVEFVRCLGHGVKLHVLLAQWAANAVILKTSDPINNHTVHLQWHEDRHRLIPKEEFVRKANLTLFLNLAGGRHVPSTLAAVERLFSECDVLGDGQLSYTEAVVCWQLLETDEFVLLSVLTGVSAVPDLYGTCGNMYAMQYATSHPFLEREIPLLDRRSWQFRARLAIALIEMVHSLETTPYGTLHLCDVKGSNFGVVRHSGSRSLAAKAIDLDLSLFESGLVHHWRLKQCHSNSQCDFVNCRVACNADTHTCSGPMTSSNLQALCEFVFAPCNQWQPSLLRDPPESVGGELRSVVEQCSSSSFPQPHINTTIMTRLLSLLHMSLH